MGPEKQANIQLKTKVVNWKIFIEKTANVSRRRHWFPSEVTRKFASTDQKHYQNLPYWRVFRGISGVDEFVGKPVMTLPNVGGFLRLNEKMILK